MNARAFKDQQLKIKKAGTMAGTAKRKTKQVWVVLCDGEPDYIYATRDEAASRAEQQTSRWGPDMTFTVQKYVLPGTKKEKR